MLIIAAYFAGFFSGAVYENNKVVDKIQGFIDSLPPEVWEGFYNSPASQEIVKNWSQAFNLTLNINYSK